MPATAEPVAGNAGGDSDSRMNISSDAEKERFEENMRMGRSRTFELMDQRQITDEQEDRGLRAALSNARTETKAAKVEKLENVFQ